ncbi:MAG: hypothetical protein R2748_13740 [Bryobacterales bacterium]
MGGDGDHTGACRDLGLRPQRHFDLRRPFEHLEPYSYASEPYGHVALDWASSAVKVPAVDPEFRLRSVRPSAEHLLANLPQPHRFYWQGASSGSTRSARYASALPRTGVTTRVRPIGKTGSIAH